MSRRRSSTTAIDEKKPSKKNENECHERMPHDPSTVACVTGVPTLRSGKREARRDGDRSTDGPGPAGMTGVRVLHRPAQRWDSMGRRLAQAGAQA